MDKRWESSKISLSIAEDLSEKTKIPLAVAKLLLSLDIASAQDAASFLKPDLKQLHNPFLLKGMKEAVDRINLALERGEKIIGHGDYDADGVATTALLKKGFRLVGAEIDVYAPNRFNDGYGLNAKNMDKFAREYDLIISGDTGVRAFDAARLVKEIGRADLIVTDHHEPHIIPADQNDDEAAKKGAVCEIVDGEKIYLPDAFAVIDPQRLGDSYPCKSLAGVGVVFKLIQALLISRGMSLRPLLHLLDYVAAGTIADLAQQIDRKTGKLDFENRVMCKYGIMLMNQQPKPWVKAIAVATSIKKESDDLKKRIEEIKRSVVLPADEADFLDSDESINEYIDNQSKKEIFRLKSEMLFSEPFFAPNEWIDSTSIGFRIGPLLNAPGRLDDPKPAVDLLLEEDLSECFRKAFDLKSVNAKRQSQTKTSKKMVKALKAGEPELSDYGIVVKCENEEYHIGIAGLVASDILGEFYRPSIALAPTEKNGKILLKGSARSIPGIHVLECLDYVKEKIGAYEYGGHEQAAGLAIEPERFEDFRKAFREACMKRDPSVFVPLLLYDAELAFDEVNDTLLSFLNLFEPYGEGMFLSDGKKPLFRSNGVTLKDLKKIMEGKGAILTLAHSGRTYRAVTFKDGARISPLHDEFRKCRADKNSPHYQKDCLVDILFSPQYNDFMGQRSIQLMLEDIKFHYAAEPEKPAEETSNSILFDEDFLSSLGLEA